MTEFAGADQHEGRWDLNLEFGLSNERSIQDSVTGSSLFLRARQIKCILLFFAAVCLSARMAIAAPALDAPNVVRISESLVTSGQPTAAGLAGLSSLGFDAVINLAPPTSPDAVRGEPEIVRKQGLSFINIPINFGQPTDSNFQEFVAAMSGLEGKKVLVHCQVNMRASSMIFLYRVVVEHQDPEKAYEAVAKIWSPEGPWKLFIAAELKQAGIPFQPY